MDQTSAVVQIGQKVTDNTQWQATVLEIVLQMGLNPLLTWVPVSLSLLHEPEDDRIPISPEEKALLDAAKRVCQHFGHVRGKVITWRGAEADAEAALVEMVNVGRQSRNGAYVCDLP